MPRVDRAEVEASQPRETRFEPLESYALVEREFTIVGEAVAALARVSPQEYPAVDDAVVWLIAECSAHLSDARKDSRRLSETPACLTP